MWTLFIYFLYNILNGIKFDEQLIEKIDYCIQGKIHEHINHEEIFPHKHLEMSVMVVKDLLQGKEKTRIEMKVGEDR